RPPPPARTPEKPPSAPERCVVAPLPAGTRGKPPSTPVRAASLHRRRPEPSRETSEPPAPSASGSGCIAADPGGITAINTGLAALAWILDGGGLRRRPRPPAASWHCCSAEARGAAG